MKKWISLSSPASLRGRPGLPEHPDELQPERTVLPSPVPQPVHRHRRRLLQSGGLDEARKRLALLAVQPDDLPGEDHQRTLSRGSTTDTYTGKTTVPLFPNVYAVYKKDRLALSLGFGPNAGGGSADYNRGLPSFETSIASLPLLISEHEDPDNQVCRGHRVQRQLDLSGRPSKRFVRSE